MDHDNLLTYPDFNKIFKIHTNASKLQWGEFIKNKVKPIFLCGRKLNDDQKRYAEPEKELLSTLETLKDIQRILLGQKLRIYNDHKILRVMFLIPTECWDRK